MIVTHNRLFFDRLVGGDRLFVATRTNPGEKSAWNSIASPYRRSIHSMAAKRMQVRSVFAGNQVAKVPDEHRCWEGIHCPY